MKKGFSLIELLVIIVILGLIAGIGTGIYTNVQKNTKEKLYQEQLKVLESKIREYILINEGKLLTIDEETIKLDIYKENNTFNIPISLLLKEKYLDSYPINPKCNKQISGYFKLTVTQPGTYILKYHMSNTEETFCKQ